MKWDITNIIADAQLCFITEIEGKYEFVSIIESIFAAWNHSKYRDIRAQNAAQFSNTITVPINKVMCWRVSEIHSSHDSPIRAANVSLCAKIIRKVCVPLIYVHTFR